MRRGDSPFATTGPEQHRGRRIDPTARVSSRVGESSSRVTDIAIPEVPGFASGVSASRLKDEGRVQGLTVRQREVEERRQRLVEGQYQIDLWQSERQKEERKKERVLEGRRREEKRRGYLSGIQASIEAVHTGIKAVASRAATVRSGGGGGGASHHSSGNRDLDRDPVKQREGVQYKLTRGGGGMTADTDAISSCNLSGAHQDALANQDAYLGRHSLTV